MVNWSKLSYSTRRAYKKRMNNKSYSARRAIEREAEAHIKGMRDSGSGRMTSSSRGSTAGRSASREAAQAQAAKKIQAGEVKAPEPDKSQWNIKEATDRRSEYLESKYEGSAENLNRENIAKKLESARKAGVYASSREVERDYRSSPRTKIQRAGQDAYHQSVARVIEIKTGQGSKITKPELKKYRGSLEPEFIAKAERRLMKEDLSSQYAGRPFVYKGKTYFADAAGEKIMQLRSSDKWDEVVRRRELSKDFDRYGGEDSSGRKLTGGIEYGGVSVFGAHAADVLARLEKGGQARVQNYTGGMEIDMDLQSDNIPIVFGKATQETAVRIQDYDRQVSARKKWEWDMIGAKMWPGSPKKEKPQAVAVEGFDLGGWASEQKIKIFTGRGDKPSKETTLGAYGLELVNVSPKITAKGKEKYVIDLKKSQWPSDVGAVMSADLPVLGRVGLGDAPILGDLTSARYHEVRSIEREYKIRMMQSTSQGQRDAAAGWKRTAKSVSGRDWGTWDYEEPNRYAYSKAEGLIRGGTAEAVYWGSRITPTGIMGQAMRAGSNLLPEGKVKKFYQDSSDYLLADRQKAAGISDRFHNLDIPGIDLKPGHRGRVVSSGIFLAASAIIPAARVVSKTAPVLSPSLIAQAGISGAFGLAGYETIGAVAPRVEKLTGSKAAGLMAGLFAGGIVSRAPKIASGVGKKVQAFYDTRFSKKYISPDNLGIDLKPIHSEQISTSGIKKMIGNKKSVLVHATDEPSFAFKNNKMTLTAGPDALAKGTRKAIDARGFYWAPELKGRPQAYLAYMRGIKPLDYASQQIDKVYTLFNPKKRLVIAKDTVRNIKPRGGESILDYNTRVMSRSGMTHIPAENIYSRSSELQAVTSSQFKGVRGNQYRGSVLELTGDRGYFTYYRQTPELSSFWGRVPGAKAANKLLRSSNDKLYLDYVTIKPAPGAGSAGASPGSSGSVVDLGDYISSYGRRSFVSASESISSSGSFGSGLGGVIYSSKSKPRAERLSSSSRSRMSSSVLSPSVSVSPPRDMPSRSRADPLRDYIKPRPISSSPSVRIRDSTSSSSRSPSRSQSKSQSISRRSKTLYNIASDSISRSNYSSRSGSMAAASAPRNPDGSRLIPKGPDVKKKKKRRPRSRREWEQFNLSLPGLSGSWIVGISNKKKSKPKKGGVF